MRLINATPEVAVNEISERIAQELAAAKRVLWLTSGGSNIALEVQVMQRLQAAAGDRLNSLTILPMDERYGPAGHADSNVKQMQSAGFDPGTATWIDVLAGNQPLPETVESYTEAASTALATADVIIGQFGMGDDGHIAGIKPHSPAAQDDPATVIGYEWDDYPRLTLSAEALKQIHVAYVPVFGTAKTGALERLENNTESFDALPAKLLYDIAEAYVYTDVPRGA